MLDGIALYLTTLLAREFHRPVLLSGMVCHETSISLGGSPMAVIQHEFRKKAAQGDSRKTPETIPGYNLRMELGFSSPPIWRAVEVCGSLTLAELSRIIQLCFGWSDNYSHRFLAGKIFYGPGQADNGGDLADEAQTKLYQLEEVMGFIFTYLHDHGGGWECEITLQKVFSDGFKSRQPRLVAANNASPPASMDDIHEYNELVKQIAQSPENRAGLLAGYQLPADFDPAVCDINGLSSLLESLKL